MSRLLIPAAVAFVFAGSGTLATDYTQERALRIECERTVEMETTDSSFERDGEPMEGRGGGGGGTVTTQKIVHIDRVVEHDDGTPLKVRREFESVEGSASIDMGERGSTDVDQESPLDGVTIELEDDDGDVEVKVVDGSEPDDSAALEGHRLALALDALLPDGDTDDGDSWDLESDDIIAALGFDLQGALFPPAQREEGGGERGGGRGRGRGMRGGGNERFMGNVEWKGKATLEGGTEDHDGIECIVITLELESSGDMPEGEGGGGFGGGDPPQIDASYEVELEGKLLFSTEAARPVLLEVEGTIETEREMEMSRGGSSMVIYTKREGEFKQTVTVSEEAGE